MTQPLSFGRLKARLLFPGSFVAPSVGASDFGGRGVRLPRCATVRGYEIGLLTGEALSGDGEQLTDPHAAAHILYFYGNAMTLSSAAYEFSQLRRLGLNVAIPEYVGYGLSSGEAGESACYDSADAAFSYLTQDLGVEPSRVFVAGWSLGAAVAVDLAARRPVAGLVAISPFTSVADEAIAQFRWLPKSLVNLGVGQSFANMRKIERVESPILIAHGMLDELVPFWMAESLAQAARNAADVTLLPIPNCGHAEVLDAQQSTLWRELGRFVSRFAPNDAANQTRNAASAVDTFGSDSC